MISKLSFGFNKKNIQLKNVVNNSVSSSHQSCATHKIWIKASRRVIGNPQPSVPWSGTIARKEGNFESFLPARNNFPVVTFQVTESYQIQIFPLVSCDTWLFLSLFPPLNATSGKYQEKSIIIDYIKQLWDWGTESLKLILEHQGLDSKKAQVCHTQWYTWNLMAFLAKMTNLKNKNAFWG